jgi:para-aminobenzoate synthetase / 4-amino-4-deoxychorismate lyase
MNQPHKEDVLLLRYAPDHSPGHWLCFRAPLRVVTATRVEDVPSALSLLDEAVDAGHFAAGYFAYEAARACDPAMATHAACPLPLAHIAVYDRAEILATLPPPSHASCSTGAWTSAVPYASYEKQVRDIKTWIQCGDTYQVNYTCQLQTSFKGDSLAWFHQLYRAQPAAYAAYGTFGAHTLCSVSPELFFRVHDQDITARPMKGTAPRGRTWDEDQRHAEQLRASVKNRAENVMILDMMRNDLGRIAFPGSVSVQHLCEVERYHTVLQMISEVSARTDASLEQIMRALFPSCSITGAPKVRTMQLIHELEPEPRGIYTGAIGFASGRNPLTGERGRHAQFSVAIRTAHINEATGHVRYGAGGGIVWDSDAGSEYAECHTKALVLASPPPPFKLLETMRWTPARGFAFLNEHLRRIGESAAYFLRPWNEPRARKTLAREAETWKGTPMRVRLLLDERGTVELDCSPLDDAPTRGDTWNLAVDDRPVDAQDRFLYHKTTHRHVYNAARARRPDADDVLLWNTRREITESCLANVAVQLDNRWYTPPVTCGLLAGVMRDALVRRGRLRERVITLEELDHAEAIVLFNSVRGFIRVRRIP